MEADWTRHNNENRAELCNAIIWVGNGRSCFLCFPCLLHVWNCGLIPVLSQLTSQGNEEKNRESWGERKRRGKVGVLGAFLHLLCFGSPPGWANIGYQSADMAMKHSRIPIPILTPRLWAASTKLSCPCNGSTHGVSMAEVLQGFPVKILPVRHCCCSSRFFLVLPLQHTFSSSYGSWVQEGLGVVVKSI